MAQINFYTATLASSLSANGAETEVYVNSITTLDGETIATSDFSTLGKGYLTIDAQSTQRVERISFTGVDATGIGFTGCVRGLKNKGGAGNTTANAFYHSVGAPVIIAFGADDITDLIAYINNTASAGAANASTTVKGIVQESTQAQVDAKTASGSTGAELYLNPSKQRSTLLSDYVADTGSANAYAIAPSPAITAYTVGQIFSFKTSNANTGASTLNVNGLGTKNIYFKQAALTGGEIGTGSVVVVEYDGTQFQMTSPASNTYNSTPSGTATQITSSSFLAGETLTAGNPVSVGYLQSDGGVKYDTVASGSGTGTNLGSATITIGNNPNRLVLISILINNAGTPGTPTIGGSNFTSINSGNNAYNAGYFVGYYVAPSTGVQALALSFGGSYQYSWIAYSLYNAKQTGQPDNHGITAPNALTGSVSVTPALAGSLLFGYYLGSAAASGASPTMVGIPVQANTIGSYPTFQSVGLGYTDITCASETVSFSGAGSASYNYVGIVTVAPATAPTFNYALTASSAAPSSYSTPLADKLRLQFIGFVTNSPTQGNTANIVHEGIVTGLTGLIGGQTYYLNDTAGTIGTSAGTNTRKIGIALSATTLLITNEP